MQEKNAVQKTPLFLGFRLPLTPWSVVYSFSHPQNEGEPKNWIIPNSQDVGSTYMATNRWTDKEKVGRTQGIIICPLKRSKFCQMWQHGWNCWMKSLHWVKYSRQRGTNTAWFHWYEVSKIVKLIETAEWWMPGAGARDGRCCSTGIGLQVCKMNKFRRSAMQLCVYS